MTNNIFPYPGGKSRYAGWIVEQLPSHTCFVEAFGGSAAILLNKPRSSVEVYNDMDDDLVQFFRVLRGRGDELVDFLKSVPYSRSLYETWADEFYSGGRPEDPIERAGRFFFLRYSQFSGKYESKSGFRTGKRHDDYVAEDMVSAREEIEEFRARFDGVIIENLDYADLLDRYDSPETVFYLDPPYVEVGDKYYSQNTEFNQTRFVNELGEIEGMFLVSYGESYPDGMEDYRQITRDTDYTINNGNSGERKTATERLFLNYDPDGRNQFIRSDVEQTRLI